MAEASEKPTSYAVTVLGRLAGSSKFIGGTATSAGGSAGGTQTETKLVVGGAVPASAASCRPLASTTAAALVPLLPRPANRSSLVPVGKPTVCVRSLTSISPCVASGMGSQSYGTVLVSLCGLQTPRVVSQ